MYYVDFCCLGRYVSPNQNSHSMVLISVMYWAWGGGLES